MNWIYSTHLETLATLEPCAAFLGLLVWTKSGGAPHSTESPRYPVTLGTLSDCANLVGVSRATMKRQWSAVTTALAQLDGNRFTPSIDAWPEPACAESGLELYVRIHPKTVQSLIGLTRRASLRRAFSSLRLALKMLPRLRAAQYHGRTSIVWTNDQIAAQMAMSRATIGPALQLLEDAGLIKIGGKRYRRISCTHGTLNKATPLAARARQAGVDSGRRIPKQRAKPVPQDRSNLYRSPKGVEQELNKEQATREARAVDCLSTDLVSYFMAQLDGLTRPGAEELARQCSTKSDIKRWLEQEQPMLETAENPCGMLICLARAGQSSPGQVSYRTRKLVKAQIAKANALMQWTPKKTLPPIQTEGLPPSIETAAQIAESRARERAHAKRIRDEAAELKAEKQAQRQANKAKEAEAFDREKNKAKIRALIAALGA